MTDHRWREALALFFAGRAREVGSDPTLDALSYVSGRDPRMWRDPTLYHDLVESIVEQLGATSESSVLELGCAAGFLAKGIAPRVREYVGVDLAGALVSVARRLRLRNARFQVADGANLPFGDATFDAALCYDVVTNFPAFDDIVPLMDELLRVVRPGGAVLIGSVPDEAARESYERRVAEMSEILGRAGDAATQGPVARHGRLWHTLERLRRRSRVAPGITCYYFSRSSFEAFAARRGCHLEFRDIHRLNPYRGMRFNALLRKIAR